MTIYQKIKYGMWGDLIHLLTNFTGIAWLWAQLHPTCNCDQRRRRWNKYTIIDMITIYKREGCPHCEQVIKPDFLKIREIYVDDPSYDGIMPPEVPFATFGSVNISGSNAINDVLSKIEIADGFTLMKNDG